MAKGAFSYDGVIFQLADGTTVGTNGWSNCDDNEYNIMGIVRKMCSHIYVDINGPNKGKNREGNDVFGFMISPDGILAYPDSDVTEEDIIDECSKYRSAFYCSYWVLTYDNMDYLKAEDGVCPNGVELSIEHTSCN